LPPAIFVIEKVCKLTGPHFAVDIMEPLAKFIRIAGPNKATARYEEF
jgi:hypothetical protein